MVSYPVIVISSSSCLWVSTKLSKFNWQSSASSCTESNLISILLYFGKLLRNFVVQSLFFFNTRVFFSICFSLFYLFSLWLFFPSSSFYEYISHSILSFIVLMYFSVWLISDFRISISSCHLSVLFLIWWFRLSLFALFLLLSLLKLVFFGISKGKVTNLKISGGFFRKVYTQLPLFGLFWNSPILVLN